MGAQESIPLGVPGKDAQGVMDQLTFLSAVRRGERPDLGQRVAVIGGGNSAMDAARTAKRLVGPNGQVSIVYRRTRQEMPAAAEEVQAMLEEGVELIELTAPECMLVEVGRLKANVCFKMELGEPDASGRPRPIKIDGSEFELNVDTVISAIGQRVNLAFFPEEKLSIDPQTHETQLENVFAGGDAVRGASTLIKAIGDGKKVAETIIGRAAGKKQLVPREPVKRSDLQTLIKGKARRQAGAQMPEIDLSARNDFSLVVDTLDEATARREAERCLHCDELCNICVTVCPNRANLGFSMAPTKFRVQHVYPNGKETKIVDGALVRIEQTPQVMNIGDFCNECGNCTTFCPTSGAPYKDKAKFHLTAESFNSARFGYRFTSVDRLEYKHNGRLASLKAVAEKYLYESDQVKAELNKDFTAREVLLKTKDPAGASLRQAAEMAILYEATRQVLPLTLTNS